MGVRLATVAAALLALAYAAAAGASPGASRSWAAPQIRMVTAAGVMSPTDPATFRPDDVLTAQALEDLVAGLKQPAATTPTRTPPPSVPTQLPYPAIPVTIARLDTRLVQTLGL